MKIICPNCGRTLSKNAVICKKCGFDLINDKVEDFNVLSETEAELEDDEKNAELVERIIEDERRQRKKLITIIMAVILAAAVVACGIIFIPKIFSDSAKDSSEHGANYTGKSYDKQLDNHLKTYYSSILNADYDSYMSLIPASTVEALAEDYTSSYADDTNAYEDPKDYYKFEMNELLTSWSSECGSDIKFTYSVDEDYDIQKKDGDAALNEKIIEFTDKLKFDPSECGYINEMHKIQSTVSLKGSAGSYSQTDYFYLVLTEDENSNPDKCYLYHYNTKYDKTYTD